MTKTTRFLSALAVSCAVALLDACINAPVEFSMKEEIEITEEKVREISEEIYAKLAELDFSDPPPATIDPSECSAAYKIWLRKQFDRGLVPKSTVLPSEYAESSRNPKIHECRVIDFDGEFRKAVKERKTGGKRKREAILFGMNEFREKLISNRCTANFIDLDKEKIKIKNITLNVTKNTLSVKAPQYKIYSSFEDESLKDELKELNAEQDLVEQGVLMLLGETRIIERRFVGEIQVDLNTNFDDFRDAEGPIVSLDGTLLAVPSVIASEPEISTIAGREYFVVPSGKISLTLSAQAEINFSGADAKCAFDRFKESIRDEQKKQDEPKPE